jgi:hypothetical protein
MYRPAGFPTPSHRVQSEEAGRVGEGGRTVGMASRRDVRFAMSTPRTLDCMSPKGVWSQ